MPAKYVRPVRNSRPDDWEHGDEWLRIPAAVMPALEASLHRSREALLAMDLEGIKSGTREQVALIRELEAAALPKLRAGGSNQSGENSELVQPPSINQLERLRRSAIRVHEAARLQSALLARARYKLRVLANMRAGLSRTYHPCCDGKGRLGA